jgi:hypothetical protein
MLYNTNQIQSLTVDNLKDTIKKRIGIEQFENKLEFISQHESYSKTLKKPTSAFKCKSSADLLFDYEFTRLFKSNETLILNLLENKNQNASTSSGAKQEALGQNYQLEQQNSMIMAQFQQIIREQDKKLNEQYQVNQSLTQTCAQLQDYCQKLNQQYNLLLNERGGNVSTDDRHGQNEQVLAERVQMQARVNELEVKCNLLEEK